MRFPSSCVIPPRCVSKLKVQTELLIQSRASSEKLSEGGNGKKIAKTEKKSTIKPLPGGGGGGGEGKKEKKKTCFFLFFLFFLHCVSMKIQGWACCRRPCI